MVAIGYSILPEWRIQTTGWITHASNRRGKVATNEWAKYFKSGGKFYK
ncbi:MAG: hypothetical protein O7G85_01365 [Planctomycetota bacterium]|nr:hypothetical protein [Planctomycetota bacterium]